MANSRVPDGETFSLILKAPGHSDRRQTLRHDAPRTEFPITLAPGEAFRNFEVYLDQQLLGHVRVVESAAPAAGSLRVEGGSQHAVGDTIRISRKIPSRRDAKGDPIPMVYELVRQARKLHGGATDPELVVESEVLEPGSDQIEFYAFSPGPYEVRLLQTDFIIDRQPINIMVRALPGALSFTNKAPRTAGMLAEFTINAPKLKTSNYQQPNYSVQMVEVGEQGLRTAATYQFQYIQWAVAGQVHQLGIPPKAGNYALQLKLHTGTHVYLVDELHFPVGAFEYTVSTDVSTPAEIAANPTMVPAIPYVFTVADQPQFGYTEILIEAGTPIPVMIDLSALPAQGAELRLYRSDPPPYPGPQPGPPGTGELLQQWSPNDFSRTGFELENTLEPGHYLLTLAMNFMGQEMPMMTHPFEVVPAADNQSYGLNLGGRQVFLLGEKPVPDWDRASWPDLGHRINGLGQRIPGCAIEFPPGSMQYPGFYLASLTDASISGSGRMVRQLGMAMRAEETSGVISLARTTWTPDETITVSATLPENHPLRSKRHGSFEVVRAGTRMGSGVVSAVRSVQRHSRLDFSDGTAAAEFRINKPGHYEIRLIQSRGSCRYTASGECLVLDRVPLIIRSESPHFNDSDGGLSAFGIATDLEITHQWPRVGESTDEVSCLPSDRIQEKMQLRFVARVGGEWTDVQPPLRFGQAFYVEGRLEDPATHNFYTARIGPGGNAAQEIALFRVAGEPRLVRSEMLYAIWDNDMVEANNE